MSITIENQQIIKTEAELRRIVPAYPKILDKRIQHKLDYYCLEFISFSTFIVTAFGQSTMPMQVFTENEVVVLSDSQIAIKTKASINEGSSASLYFMIKGVGHGLRVNGVFVYDGDNLILRVKSAYLHCARAAARAELWNKERNNLSSSRDLSVNEYLKSSPYLLLKSINEHAQTEISPRGDQSGFVHLVNEGTLFIPERPGNKVAVSLRNIVKNKKVELLFIIPGSHSVLHVSGDAVLTTDDTLLDTGMVNKKRPKLGVLINQCRFCIAKSKTIQQSRIWEMKWDVNTESLTKFSKALAVHMNGEGLIGKASTHIIKAVVKHDMKNLY